MTEPVAKRFEFRVGKWLDTKTKPVKPVFGVESRPILAKGETHAKTSLGKGWTPCMQDGKALAFNTEPEAQVMVADLNSTDQKFTEVPPVARTLEAEVNPKELEYTLVYLFNKACNKVLLIHKDHPHWQANRWNGLGGKVTPEDASPLCGAVREVFEEAGIGDLREPQEIMHMVTWQGNGYLIHIYCGTTDRIDQAKTMTSEEVQVYPVDNLPRNIYDDVKGHITAALLKLSAQAVL